MASLHVTLHLTVGVLRDNLQTVTEVLTTVSLRLIFLGCSTCSYKLQSGEMPMILVECQCANKVAAICHGMGEAKLCIFISLAWMPETAKSA